ncbi:MAG: helix-turn-helix domain-containing protein [Saccharothrix sp.]|nr:helix-turn-helix domain-containing protein [Saccharothrix sp.]
MVASPRSRELGDRLEQLKLASGRSYEGIGRKVHLSKSAVHRYCTGASVPQEFAVVERIARACGASREELVRLHRAWLRATAGADGDVVDVVDVVPEQPSPVVDHRPPPSRPFARFKVPLTLVVIALVLVLLPAGGSRGVHSAGGTGGRGGQWVAGPSWQLPPTPVRSTLFGVTINSATGEMPAFRVGAARFWDGGTRWSEIQRRRGEFEWSALERLVAGAEKAGLPALFVFGGTPKWANPAGAAGPYPDGTSAPPVDLADWDLFVRTLVERYRGRLEAYELWVLGNDRRFFSGSVETLVEMTRRANGIIRSLDPGATVVCPGMGELWNPEGLSFLKRFIELGGYDHCDVASIKLFQRKSTDPPETMLEITDSVDRVMHDAGVHRTLWSTGTAYSIPTQERLDRVVARNYAVRFFLTGIYARKVNLERMYFYNWGGTKIPIVLQPVGGSPTDAALAVEQVQHWLRNAHVRSCGHGATAALPENVWQCDFTVLEPDRTYEATIRWTDRGTATTTAGPRIRELRRLDGTVEAVDPGDSIGVTEEPVLLATPPTSPR